MEEGFGSDAKEDHSTREFEESMDNSYMLSNLQVDDTGKNT